jgi:hypothetical protein
VSSVVACLSVPLSLVLSVIVASTFLLIPYSTHTAPYILLGRARHRSSIVSSRAGADRRWDFPGPHDVFKKTQMLRPFFTAFSNLIGPFREKPFARHMHVRE